MASRTALVFPGQGSQRVGMLENIPEHDALVRLLDAAEALSGLSLRRFAEQGPDDALSNTLVAQPLLYLADWAWGSLLLETGLEPAAVSGHSLGELAALAIAQVYSVEAGLELVIERSRLMAEAAENNPGGMAAVLGMDSETIAECVASIGGVWVANDNTRGQVVISGTDDGLGLATRALTTAGARKVVPLAVAGPFHSPLMKDAADEFGDLLAQADFADAVFPVYQNTDPTPTTDASAIRARLQAQITAPVRWTETMEALAADGVRRLVEAGPGSVLSGLTRKIDGLVGVSVETEGLESIIEEVETDA